MRIERERREASLADLEIHVGWVLATCALGALMITGRDVVVVTDGAGGFSGERIEVVGETASLPRSARRSCRAADCVRRHTLGPLTPTSDAPHPGNQPLDDEFFRGK